MKRLALAIIALILAAVAQVVVGGHQDRFRWVSQSKVQHETDIIVYQDQVSGKCYAVYQYDKGPSYGGAATATSLGEVPCGR